VIGGGLDSPLPTLGVGLVSMNMSSSLSVVARSSLARHLTRRCETSCFRIVVEPADEPPGAVEESGRAGRWAAPRLADGARGERGWPLRKGYRPAPRHSDAPGLPLPMDGMGRNI
jgi:hypothetical protein